MRRRRASSIAANPVLIGAATTLVVIVAVFLAYNANEGLPFVPTYQLQAEVPDAANLVKGNDVRIAGTRVGTVTTIAPQKHSDGSVTAVLTLKMQTSVKPLPKDSTVLIRPRSALGLKYVESLPHIAQGKGTTIFLPAEAAGVMGAIGGLKELLKAPGASRGDAPSGALGRGCGQGPPG